jgi:hypothetical protein
MFWEWNLLLYLFFWVAVTTISPIETQPNPGVPCAGCGSYKCRPTRRCQGLIALSVCEWIGKGRIAGHLHISWEKPWFPVDFPTNPLSLSSIEGALRLYRLGKTCSVCCFEHTHTLILNWVFWKFEDNPGKPLIVYKLPGWFKGKSAGSPELIAGEGGQKPWFPASFP